MSSASLSTQLRVTYVGTATVLLELQRGPDHLRVLTDPVFDAPGASYALGGFRYTRLAPPALSPQQLPPIDLVLLSHDHHGDNFDSSGRRVAADADEILTTPAGAARLSAQGLGRVRGLAPWAATTLRRGGLSLEVTATPARHGPPLSLPIVGRVTGFLLEWTGQQGGPLWISGDTVWHRALEPLAERRIDTALMHVGAAGPRLAPFFRVSMDARELAHATERLSIRRVCPIHYEGWTHFQQGQAQVRAELERRGLAERCLWLAPATPIDLGASLAAVGS